MRSVWGVFAIISVLLLVLPLSGEALADLPGQELALNPAGLAYEANPDSQGSLWISDFSAHEIWQVNPASGLVQVYPVGGAPSDARRDDTGMLWWGDALNGRLMRLTLSSGALRMWQMPGSSGLYGSGVDGAGNLWVTDINLPRMYRLNPTSNEVCTYALPLNGRSDYLVAAGDFIWLGDQVNSRIDRLQISANSFNSWQLPVGSLPEGLALDPEGWLWWADANRGLLGSLNWDTNWVTGYTQDLVLSPQMIDLAFGLVWYTDGVTFGSLNPDLVTGTGGTVLPGTFPVTPACAPITPQDLSPVSPTSPQPAWTSVTYPELAAQYGWQTYQLPEASFAWGVSVLEDLWLVDQGTKHLAKVDLPDISLQVNKTPSRSSVPETGADVTFTYDILNTSLETPLTLTSLSDSVFGVLSGDVDCHVGAQLLPGAGCDFSLIRRIAGDASGAAHTNTFTVDAESPTLWELSASAQASVTFTNVLPSITVSKTAAPTSVPETGGNVLFTFSVNNTSPSEAVTIASLADSVFGKLTGDADCAVGTVLPVGGACQFSLTRWIEGDYSGPDHANTFAARVVDNENSDITAYSSATVVLTNVLPSLAVTKTASPTSVPESGGNVSFTFTVQNTSPAESVTLTSLTDSVFGTLAGDADCMLGTSLPVGASCQFSQVQWLAGNYAGAPHVNTFTARAADNDNTEALATASATVHWTDVLPTISVSKTASPTSVPETGGNVTFTFTVQNSGTFEAVTLTALSDSDFGALAGDAYCMVGTSLAVGSSCQFNLTRWIEGDAAGSAHSNTFTARAVDNDNTEASAQGSATVAFSDVLPSISASKTPDPASVPETGANVLFTFTVTNTSAEEAVKITSLSDSVFGTLPGDADCTLGTWIPVSGSCQFSLTRRISGDHSGPAHTNTFTARVVDNESSPAVATASAAVTFTNVLPSISVSKTANPTSVPETGANVLFTFTVNNTSTIEAVKITSLSDSDFGTLAGDADCAVNTWLPVGASCQFTLTRGISGDASGPAHQNTFTARAVDNDNTEAVASATATVVLNNALPTLTVSKVADPASVPETGADVIFTFTVSNTSSIEPVKITVLSDSAFGTLAGDADCALNTWIPVGASCQFSLTRHIAGDASGPEHENTFTARVADNEGTEAAASDSASVTFTNALPAISANKTASPTSLPETGGQVTFTFTVSNTGLHEPVTLTSLSDSVFGTLTGDADCQVGTSLAVGASCQFSLTRTIAGDDSRTSHVNTFTARAVDNENSQVEASASATVTLTNVLPTLGASKTASPTVVPETGGNVLFTFAVSNTNSLEAVKITVLSDSVFGTLPGDADCAVNTWLPAGASCQFSFTRWIEGDYSGPDHANTFTAHAVDNENSTAEASAGASVDLSNVLPTISVSKTASPTGVPETGGNVTFTFGVHNTSTEEPVTLTSLSDSAFGSLPGDADCQLATSLAAGASCQFSLTRWIAGDASGPDHANTFTALAVDNDASAAQASASATVSLNNAPPTLTVSKTASPTQVPETGADVTFTFTVSNTSPIEAAKITELSDNVFGPLSGDADCTVDTWLAAGASCQFSLTRWIAGDASGPDHTNTFTAGVVDNEATTAEASAGATVALADALPVITVSKTASPASIPETGGDVTFTFTVSNSGPIEPVRITALSDNVFGTLAGDADCAVNTWIPVGGSCQFSLTRWIAAPNIEAGHLNTFTASVADNENSARSASASAVVILGDVLPALSVDKTASPSSVPETGASVLFTFTVNNTSVAETVEILSLSDSVFGTLAGDTDCAVGASLLAGASCQFSLSRWIAGDYSGSDHANTFTALVEDDEGSTAEASASATVTFTNALPSLAVSKTANPTSVPETGGNVTYTLGVQNTSLAEPVTLTALYDSVFGALTGDADCQVGTVLPVGAACQFSFTRWIAAGNSEVGHVNTFTARAVDNDATEAVASASATVTLTNLLPSLTASKTASPTSVPETGANVLFTFTIQNTSSSEAVQITSLADSIFGSLPGDADCAVGTSLPVGGTCQFSLTRWIAGDHSGPAHANTFTARAEDDELTEAVATASATVTFADALPSLTASKTASPTSVPETGANVIFTFTVTNTSPNEAAKITELSDNVFGPLSGDADCALNTWIPAGASCQFSLTRFIKGDASGPAHQDTFTTRVVDNEASTAAATASATVTISNVLPSISVSKTATPTTLPETGGNVTFTFTVTNTSAGEAVKITSLVDSAFGTLAGDADCALNTSLPVGASCQFAASRWIAGDDSGPDHTNLFTARAVDNENTEAVASASATVTWTNAVPSISVSKTASPTSMPEGGGNVTFTFTVSNLSPTEAVRPVSLSDSDFGALAGDANCAVGTWIPAATSCSFSLTRWLEGDYSGPAHENTFTARVADNENSQVQASAGATVTFSDVLPSISVTKTANPTSVPETGGEVLFTFTLNNLSPIESVKITALSDSVFGALPGDTDCAVDTWLPVGASCQFTLTRWIDENNSASGHLNTFTVVVVDNDASPASASASAIVALGDVLPAISASKVANPTSVPETGGEVTFTFTVTNDSPTEVVTLDLLSDSDFGVLSGDADCAVGTVLPVGAACQFSLTRWIAGDASGPDHTNTFTARALDDEQTEAQAFSTATVVLLDALPALSVEKTASTPSLPETGQEVTFTFTVTNPGEEALTLLSLQDSAFGSLAGDPDCQVGSVLAAGAACQFTLVQFLSGSESQPHHNTFTAVGEDNEGNAVQDAQELTITFYPGSVWQSIFLPLVVR